MQSLPVQFAGTTAGTPPVAMGFTGTASADNSFASTFGQALADAPDYVPNGSPIPSKAQNEPSNAGNSDGTSMAVSFLNCFVANLVQPAPTVAASGEAGTTRFSPAVSTNTPTSDSLPQADTSPSSPAVLTSAIPGASAALSDRQNVAARASLPQVGAGLSGPTEATGAGSNAQPTSPDLDSAAATVLPPQMDDVVANPVVATGTGAGTAAAPLAVQNTAAPVTFASAAHQETPTTADASLPVGDRTTQFATGHNWTNSKTGATRSHKDAVASSATQGSGETTTGSTGRVAAQTSPPVPADFPAIATTAELPNPQSLPVVASSEVPQSGRTEADPLPVQTASMTSGQVSGTQGEATSRLNSGSWTGSWQFDAGPAQASFHAASQYFGQSSRSISSAGQTGWESLAAEPAAPRHASTTSDIGSSATPSALGSIPVSSTNNTTAAVSANDSTEPKGSSDPLAGFADGGLTITSVSVNATGPAQVGQGVQAANPAAGSDTASPGDVILPGATDTSTVAEQFAGAAVTVRVYGRESSPVSSSAAPAATSAPVAVGAPREGHQPVAVVPLPAAKAANSTGPEVRREHFPAADRTPDEAGTAGQKVNDSPAPAVVELPSAAATAVPIPSTPASHPAIDSADAVQRTKEATGVQDGSAAPVSESANSSNLPEASSGEQGKSGQQSGSRSGDKPAAAVVFSPVASSTVLSDSAASLVAVHATSVPVGHTVTTPPQTPASSTQPAAGLAAWQSYDGGPGKIVRSASITDSPSGAEMHVELRAGNLGALEVHTVVREGSVGAEIHVQGQEAHTLLSAGLPSLERALGERNLRVESIAVYQDQTGAGTSGGEQRGQQSGSSPSPPRQSSSWDHQPRADTAATSSTEDEDSDNPAAGLSVQA